ncbi:MAG TPA: hypothetical protein VGR57_05430, partial [Ktedonobacterales bacterium]|nr:hypothetical protein [Ktedonobacterales bacterium]
PGWYNSISCAFNGTASYAPATGGDIGQPLLVSLNHSLGGAQLYSDPATIAPGQAVMYVVLHAAMGGPTPSGSIAIRLGGAITSSAQVGPAGDILLHLYNIPSLNGVSQIQLFYFGDAYYGTGSYTFPLTNPLIPGSGGGSGGAQPTATATPLPTATATATPTATSVPQSTATPVSDNPRTVGGVSTPWYQSGGLWWAIAAIVLGGGGGGAFWWLRRGKAAGAATQTGAQANASPADGPAPPADPAS